MDGIKFTLLKMLLESLGFLTYESISLELNVSSRSVSRYIKEINDFIVEYNVSIAYIKTKGFIINGDLEDIKVLQEVVSNHDVMNFSSSERMIIIVLELFSSNEFTKLYYLSYLLDVSQGTIYRDLERIMNYLALNRLELKTERGIGVKIEGLQRNRLQAIANFIHSNINFSSAKPSYSAVLSRGVTERLEKFLPIQYIQQVKNMIDEFDYTLSVEFVREDYSLFIVICSLLIFHNERWVLSVEAHEEFGDFLDLVYIRMTELAKKINDLLNILLSDTHIMELSVAYLTMRRIESNLSVYQYDHMIFEETQIFLNDIESCLSVSLNRNTSLIERLVVHIRLMINRIRMNIVIGNTYLERVIRDDYTLLQTVKKSLGHFEKKYKIQINDNEIGYIMVHIMAMVMKQENDQRRIKVTLLCMSGMGTSHMIFENLVNRYPLMNIDTMQSIESFCEHDLILQGYDLVISTILVETNELECVFVHPILGDLDYESLDSVYYKLINSSKKRENGTIPELGNYYDFNYKTYYLRKLSYIQQILNDFDICQSYASNLEEFITDVAFTYFSNESSNEFKEKIRKRETLGSSLVHEKGLLLVHCRVANTKILKLYKLKIGFTYKVECRTYHVNRILLMVAPDHAEEPYLEVLSSISNAFVLNDGVINAVWNEEDEILFQCLSIHLIQNTISEVKI